MIFYLWYIIWLVTSSSIPAYIIPFLALMVRSTYYDQEFRFIKMQHIVFSLFLLAFFLLSLKQIELSLVNTLRLLGFMALSYQISSRLTYLPSKKFPRSLGNIWFIIVRDFRTIVSRRNDFQFAINEIIPDFHGNLFLRMMIRLKYSFKMIPLIILDTVLFTKRLWTIIESRGGMPHIKKWQYEGKRKHSYGFIAVGDICFLLLLTSTLYFTSPQTVPQYFIEVGGDLKYLIKTGYNFFNISSI